MPFLFGMATKTKPAPIEMGECRGCGTLIPFNNDHLNPRGKSMVAMTQCECGTQNTKVPGSHFVRRLP